MIPYKDFLKIFDEFNEIFTKGNAGKYVGAISTSTEATIELEKTGRSSDLDKIKENMRARGEDPDLWCIVVFLANGVIELPQGVFPEKYKGFNVYVLPPMGSMSAGPAYPDEE